MSKIIKFRHLVTGDIRRVSFGSWPDLQGIHSTLVSLFGSELPSPYNLSYTDSDGDLVSITSSTELQEAFYSVRGSSVLTLSVGPKPSQHVHHHPSAVPIIPNSTNSPSLRAVPSFFTSYSSSSSPQKPVTGSSFSSPHSIRLDQSVTASQAHDTLFIDEWAPRTFLNDFRRLLELGYAWEQTRDILIDFGGDYNKAAQALRSISRRLPSSTARPYFSVSFAQMARELSSAGFPLQSVIEALIRNGGVAANAALELASQSTNKVCPRGHNLEVSSYNLGDYANYWYCNVCSEKNAAGQRWFCLPCRYDVCFHCLAPPPAPPTSTPVATPVSPPVISDMSLPPSLLEPVRMLEAMGFNDRMRVIEMLVKKNGDIVQCATQLAEERRQEEEKEAIIRRQQERARLQEERRRAREEAERRAAEERALAERRRQEEIERKQLESKRQSAAKIAVATPEKIGAGLASLVAMGFDPISSTTSLFNAGGNVDAALEELLRGTKL